MTTINLLLSPAAHNKELILLKLDAQELQTLYDFLDWAIDVYGGQNTLIKNLHSEVYFALQECKLADNIVARDGKL